jgi:hypothetical protein
MTLLNMKNKDLSLHKHELLVNLCVSPNYIVTNAPHAHTLDEIEVICAIRWRIEQCHRELKQTTGLERCQCRKAQIQRNHIACCLLVWHRLKALAIELESNIYQLKQGLLDAYMRKQLKKPDLVMAFS